MTTVETRPDLETIRSTIRDLIADVAGTAPEALEAGTGLDALGIDSLLIVEVVVGIHRRFGVQVPPSAFRADVRTVGQVCEVLGDFVHGAL